MTEEKMNQNYVLWCDLLKKYNCYSQTMIDEIGESIKNASFALDEKNGAGQGSMLDVVIHHLMSIACHLNDRGFGDNGSGKQLHQLLHVEKNTLVKVLLLQHIAKCDLFVPTVETWKKSKGYFYDFNPNLNTSMKLGQRSTYLCTKYGITFTEEEYEAMTCIDKENKDLTAFTSPLCAIVVMANGLTAMEVYNSIKANK